MLLLGVEDDLAELLAGLVVGVSLAGNHDLDGVRRLEDASEPVAVLEDQTRALVRGEAAGESDHQGVLVEHASGTLRVGQ